MSDAAARTSFPPTPAQRRAADPRRSVWVTANAGTGKTRVLADRVLRLLLAGAHPESILCITFTKAAAAEMATRIERQLARWSVTPDEDALRAELEELTGEPPTSRTLGRARRLFAQVLDLSHGLRIMTTHALCQALLKRFPLEAGVAPHFETIDERTSEELKAEARQIVLAERCGREADLRLAVDALAVTLAETTLTDAVDEMLRARHRLAAAFAGHHPEGRCDGLLAHIDGLLEVEAGLEPAHHVERACADGTFDGEALLSLANTFATGGKRQKDAAQLVATFLDSTPGRRRELFEDYRAVFFNKQGEPRRDVVSEAFRRDRAPDARIYDREQARLGEVHDRIRALLLSRRTAALLRLGHAVIDTYEALKRRSALLDFDDLIEHARLLLSTPGRKEWVLFKLDQRLDHVLVDEAQDTSPGQWAVVERLTEEFLAGMGAKQGPRTLFVVGDEKQSIYSFQGADLANFRDVHGRLLAQANAAELSFGREALDVSFRSSRAVLELVDAVLARDEMLDGTAAGGAVRHETNREHAPGLVEVWPLAEHEDGEAAQPWPLPDRARLRDRPERQVAGAIARTIRGWLTSGEPIEDGGRLRPMRAGDVLVLVSRRGTIQEQVIRALKNAGVPVAGADRLPLYEHIAVKDLVALGRAILLPEDDLTLATLLKSPLLGLDEEALFHLAWDRERSSILERLRERAEAGDEPFAAAFARLSGWMRRADFTPPFEFYAHVLGADRGRERLLARLGPDAAEPIEAFLGQALAYERGHPASLEGFLHWLGLSTEQLKRDPEHARDAVRVMTVHGAKGLEAPVVFLADAGPRGSSPRDILLWLREDGGIPLARPRKEALDARCGLAVAAEERALREEQQRLLYVALTRARDRLYVTGWKPRRGGRDAAGGGDDDAAASAGAPCWHETVRQALGGLPDVERFEVELGRSYRGEALRLRRGVEGTAAARAMMDVAGAAAAPGVPPPLPAWAQASAPAEPARERTLAPSRLGADPRGDGEDGGEDGEPAPDSPAGVAARERIRRGTLVHRLLQVLPGLPEQGREDAGRRLIERTAGDLPPETREGLLEEVTGVLRHPALADLFGPGSRAEQPLCGRVGGVMVAGQVDRLAVTPDLVLLADYKTGRRPPRDVAATPRAYLRQMAAYRALLLKAYPGREVRAALVWTQGPRVDLLPPALLDSQALAPPAAASPAAPPA